MQTLIRGSEQRVAKERKFNEAARVKKNTILLVSLFLLACFALTNIVLLRSVLSDPIGGGAAIDDPANAGSPGMGPLLRERLRNIRSAPGKSFNRIKNWVHKHGNGTEVSAEPAVDGSFEKEQLDITKEERLKLQALHDALKGRSGSDSSPSQVLKQAVGATGFTDTDVAAGQEVPPAETEPPPKPAAESAASDIDQGGADAAAAGGGILGSDEDSAGTNAVGLLGDEPAAAEAAASSGEVSGVDPAAAVLLGETEAGI